MKTKRKVLLRANKMLSNCKSESNCLTLRFTIVLNYTLAYLCKVMCAELAGDFHLGDSRQLTDKSLLPFDLVS